MHPTLGIPNTYSMEFVCRIQPSTSGLHWHSISHMAMTAKTFYSMRMRAYPKSRNAPYDSTIMPIMGHLMSTIKIPPKKNAVPFNLCGWKKNLYVFSIPMMNTIPATKRICGKVSFAVVKMTFQLMHTHVNCSRGCHSNTCHI